MRWVIACVLFLVLALSAAGIGIAPAETELSLRPGESKTLEFRAYNTEAEDITVAIAADGSLADHVTLSQETLTFTKTERIKRFSVTITAPDRPRDFSGNITLSAGTDVSGHISVVMQGMPTGNVVQETDGEKDHTFAILLTVLIAGNVIFFVVAGVRKSKRTKQPTLKKVATVEELVYLLKTIDEKTFRSHVTKDTNEFAEWLKDHGHPELAYRIYDLEGKEQMIAALSRPLPDVGKDPETLMQEAQELKRELDTFEFSGFEKVYK